MSETRYAVLVGINDYESGALEYCVNDVESIADCFLTYCDFNEKNIFTIKSTYQQPAQEVDALLETLIERIGSGFRKGADNVFFYFSGHGVKSDKTSTAIAFKEKVVYLDDIYRRILTLEPKFIFFLIDSCYSGVGLTEGIDKSAEEYHFKQHLAVSTGYAILSASAHDRPAKENSEIKGGRFTRLFIDVVTNSTNYRSGILTVNHIYQLLDDTLKDNPSFRQLPFSQIKGLSTYPLAFLQTDKANLYYANHYIDDIDTYDWSTVSRQIRAYCSSPNRLINELVRLLREILRNAKQWGKATFLQIEISKDKVAIIDDSTDVFDIFYPPGGTRKRGGLRTAEAFMSNFQAQFNYSAEVKEGRNLQVFNLMPADENPCVLTIDSIFTTLSLLESAICAINVRFP